MQLDGKVAIITGASSGIGAAAARTFAAAGASVILGARRRAHLNMIVDDIEKRGGRAAGVAGDIRNEAYAAQLVETALSRFGRLDIGFNNAGVIGETTEAAALTEEAWRSTLDTNLTGAFLCAKHQLAPMIDAKGGSIIFTSSFVGQTMGFPGMAAYAASKAGMVGLAQCLAVEYGARDIRINALMPGGTKTPMAGDFDSNPDAEQMIAGFHALKRMAEPEEIANAALFLASDAASFITGSALYADGGNSITKL